MRSRLIGLLVGMVVYVLFNIAAQNLGPAQSTALLVVAAGAMLWLSATIRARRAAAAEATANTP